MPDDLSATAGDVPVAAASCDADDAISNVLLPSRSHTLRSAGANMWEMASCTARTGITFNLLQYRLDLPLSHAWPAVANGSKT